MVEEEGKKEEGEKRRKEEGRRKKKEMMKKRTKERKRRRIRRRNKDCNEKGTEEVRLEWNSEGNNGGTRNKVCVKLRSRSIDCGSKPV